MLDGYGLLVFTDEYGFGGGECGYGGVGFMWGTILDDRCGISMEIFHDVGVRANGDVGLLKKEFGGFHIISNGYSDKFMQILFTM